MKLIMLALLALVLCGCNRLIYDNDLKKAVAFCEDKGGVTYLEVYGEGYNVSVRCNNGAYAMVHTIKEKK